MRIWSFVLGHFTSLYFTDSMTFLPSNLHLYLIESFSPVTSKMFLMVPSLDLAFLFPPNIFLLCFFLLSTVTMHMLKKGLGIEEKFWCNLLVSLAWQLHRKKERNWHYTNWTYLDSNEFDFNWIKVLLKDLWLGTI